MSKFFLSMSSSEHYTDNRFGRIMSDMLETVGNESVVIFREHLIFLIYDKENRQYDFKLYKIHENNDDDAFITVEPEEIVHTTHDCHKYIGYILMSKFRTVYPELKEVDFPVEEFKIWFEYDMSSYVFFNDEE